jgi:mono/diheme cytochrome c family protein
MSPHAEGGTMSYSRPASRARLFVAPFVGLALLFSLGAAPLPDDNDDNPYRPGLVARYLGGDGAEHVRLEEEVSHVWNDLPPDRRVPPGPFSARYSGRLWTQSPGAYRLYAVAAGSVRLKLGGKLLLDAHSGETRWHDAEPVELPFGFHPLEIEYRRADEPARLALYWQGPQFRLEPVAGRWLFHDAAQSPTDEFERGERLVRALRCAACHELQGEPPALRAPALSALSGNLSHEWFVDWLSNPAAGERMEDRGSARRMPHFGASRDQARAMVDALVAASEAPPEVVAESTSAGAGLKPPKKKKEEENEEPPPPPSVAAGQTLFRSLGCLACHRLGELGADGLFGGGDLAHVAGKRPADFFARWLARPEASNRDHRMPVFALDDHELASLSLYLQTLTGPDTASQTQTAGHTVDGVRLLREARCAACHRLPESLAAGAEAKPARLETAALARGEDTCLFEPDAGGLRPGYRLNGPDRAAIGAFIAGIRRVPDAPVAHGGRQLLVEQNCLACHARGSSAGLAARLPAVIEAEAAFRELLAALEPPALFGVGDKLHDAALAAAIRTPQVPRRAWLQVRMPKFALGADETAALVSYFVETDRIPPRPEEPPPAEGPPDTALDAAGPRLVTADGFGCTSCHAIGDWTPPKVAPNARGSQLGEIGGRIRREWFDRWVRDPARIVPKMEMPAVQQSIRGVLDRDLDAQLAAVWRVLERASFTPPAPGALRVVRRANLPDTREPAAVLTDVIEAGGAAFAKPLVIGLENRHNVLFDMGTGRLAAWWIGDVARQQTLGKTWYWEAGVPQLLAIDDDADDAPGELSLVRGETAIAPRRGGQYVSEFELLEHVGSGVRFSTRLRFGRDDAQDVVRVVQEFQPIAAGDSRSGFRRRVHVETAASHDAFELVVLPGDVVIAADARSATLAGPIGELRVSLAGAGAGELVQTPRGAVVRLDGPTRACALEYRSEAAADSFAPLGEVDRRVTRAALAVVPGFEGLRLPVTDEAMPTGLAWRDDGTLVVSSLEGRVWLGHDTDGDGVEDKLVPFSDELAAPYGVAAAGEAIDVITKYGLLRLFDADADGQAERTQLLASGWGHTRDYHDWAVGLPRDGEGNYYVSFGCQQDDRSQKAARLRGRVARLTPRAPSDDDPRLFEVEEIAGGFRFAQGIALSREGDVFVTDQQGHYTPFNELNHVMAGQRYGFINYLESKGGLDPPFTPAAIEIPHPWTRSVNGICFLETPEAARASPGGPLFGPFEGHLVGCEYTTLRLVRMSLERVEGDFQGAVYPFSIEPAAGGETFEGPLVCRVAPDGDLYIGNIHDSGWGAGSNTGSLVRLRRQGELASGIAEVRAASGGFSIDFTRPVDRARAADVANYAIWSFRRIPTPSYGGEDVDRRLEAIHSIRVADDALSVTIELDEPREGFVYEFHLRNLGDGERFFPDEAYYTLRHRAR